VTALLEEDVPPLPRGPVSHDSTLVADAAAVDE